jgi:hypothetical protein
MVHKIELYVILYGEEHKVTTLKEAEDRMRRHELSDFHPSYILRKEYSKSGKLLNEIMVG